MKYFTIIYAIILILLTGCGAPERKSGEGYTVPSQDLTFKSLRSMSYTTGTLSEVLYSDDGFYYLSPDIHDILELNNVHVDIYDDKGSIKSTLDSDSAYYYLADQPVGEHLRKTGDIDMYGSEDKPVHYNSANDEFVGPHVYRSLEKNSLNTSSTYVYYMHKESETDSNVFSRQEAQLIILDEGNSYRPAGATYKAEYRRNIWPTPTITSEDPVTRRDWENKK